jgi:hypothetical protein
MWMWGDRFLDGAATGLGEWEASLNQTWPAIDRVPSDVVICDWHYDKAAPTAALFAAKGFSVVSSPWRKPDVAIGQLELVRSVRGHANEAIASRMLGMLHTTWCGFGPFARGYFGEGPADPKVMEAVNTFRTLYREIRNGN